MAMTLDVRDLVGHPGASRRVVVHEPLEGVRLELARVREDAPIDAELLLESVVEGILVTGPLTGPMVISCARCLKSFERRVDVRVQELFARSPGPEDDQYPLGAEASIDLEPMVRDALLLTMPFSPLCRPDCLGLCSRCGGDRNLGECSCPEEVADPRWSALEGIFES